MNSNELWRKLEVNLHCELITFTAVTQLKSGAKSFIWGKFAAEIWSSHLSAREDYFALSAGSNMQPGCLSNHSPTTGTS